MLRAAKIVFGIIAIPCLAIFGFTFWCDAEIVCVTKQHASEVDMASVLVRILLRLGVFFVAFVIGMGVDRWGKPHVEYDASATCATLRDGIKSGIISVSTADAMLRAAADTKGVEPHVSTILKAGVIECPKVFSKG